MRLINFDQAAAISELMQEFGFKVGLGEFLSLHLTEVLRRQHAQVVIESIEFLREGKCDAKGFQTAEQNVVNLYALDMPFDVRVVLNVGVQRMQLDLNVIIKWNSHEEESKQATTDVRILEQLSLEPMKL